jgi:hypothetical protein
MSFGGGQPDHQKEFDHGPLVKSDGRPKTENWTATPFLDDHVSIDKTSGSGHA